MPARPGSGTRQPDGPPPPGGWDLAASYSAHERRVYRICLAILHDRAAAEDATQETFIRVGPHLHGVSEARLGSYLATIARNVSTDELRRRGSRRRALDELHRIEPLLEPEEVAVDRHLVATTWSRLATRERALFLYRFAGYTYEEMAVRFGMSADAVRKSLVRARGRARRLLDGVAAVGLVPVDTVREVLRARRRRRGTPPARARRAMRISRLAPPGVWSVTSVAVTVAAAGVTSAAVAAAHPGTGSLPAPALVGQAVAIPDAALPGMRLTGLVASADGRTLLGSGYPQPGCELPGCAALERSDDGGASWRRLPARGFAGGAILLPGSMVDATLFAAGPQGLQRSDDGGASFRTVVPVAAPVTVVAAGEHPRLVIASHPVRIYDAATGAVSAAAPLGWPGEVTSAVAGRRGDHVLVSARAPASATGVVLDCELRGACRELLAVPGSPELRLVRGAGDGPVVALTAGAVYLEPAPGAAFGPGVAVPGRIGAAAAVADGRGGTRVLVSFVEPRGAARLLRIAEGPRGEATTTLLDPGSTLPLAADLVVAGGGRLLATLAVPDAFGKWGVRCSTDDGMAWLTRC